MSFETLSAENRNNINMSRCCSFCRRGGHRINNCDDVRLNMFEDICTNYIDYHGIDTFYEFLLEEAITNPNIVKAFSIRNCNSTTRNHIDVCIDNIVNYFRRRYQQNTNTPQEVTAEQSAGTEQSAGVASPSDLEYGELIVQTYIRDLMLGRTLGQLTRSESETVLTLLITLRTLQENYSETEENRKFEIKTHIIENDNGCLDEKCECDICYENFDKINFIRLNCTHEFCKDCLKKSLQNETKPIPCCALCRKQITNFNVRDPSIKDEFMEIIQDI